MGHGFYGAGGVLYKSALFVLASFVFSYIFWWTKKIMEKPAAKKK